ncbi:MAG: hypothetical protein ACYDBY_08195 [Thermoanaerobaculia bacterium]
MRRVPSTSALLVSLVLVTPPVLASGGAGVRTPASPPARGSLEKTTEGRVTELASGRHLTLRTDDGATVTFRLDEQGLETEVAPEVAVGVRARVVETRLADGALSISVTVVPAPTGHS